MLVSAEGSTTITERISLEIAVLRLSRAVLDLSDIVDGLAHEHFDTGAKPGRTGAQHEFSQTLFEVRSEIKAVAELLSETPHG
jgi:hypothetical protein